MLIEHGLYAGHYTKLLTHINAFKFHSNSMRYLAKVTQYRCMLARMVELGFNPRNSDDGFQSTEHLPGVRPLLVIYTPKHHNSNHGRMIMLFSLLRPREVSDHRLPSLKHRG